ncbi:MAG TPA: class I adenylate-forming enzyme family protein [Polyangia bacterium]|jgi:long-chain acyl-CoA synthetase|nr:class I adenylate-forming enzyme family protein [Polyangia bacterium]
MLLYQWLSEVTRKYGSAKALVYRDTYLSWRGLAHRVDRRAQELASMGIGKGQWIGLMLGNVPDFSILALALSKLGATVVPLDPTMGARELGVTLELAPLRGLITRPRGGVDQPQTPLVGAKANGGKKTELVEVRRRLQGTLLTCSLYKRPDGPPPGAEVVLFTSDSMGEAKGVLRTKANLVAGTEQLRETLEITPEDRILTTVPLHHAYGFDVGLCLSLRYGATLYIEDDVAPKRVAKILREQEIDVLPGNPSLYAGLAKVPTAKSLKQSRTRYLSSGEPLGEATADAFRQGWGIRILAMYHTTEAHAIALDRKGQNPDSVGKAVEGVSLRIGAGESVWVRSAAVAQEAISLVPARPVKRNEVPIGRMDAEGWYRTGDRGRLDRSGRLYLTGREDDLVKVDGKRVALGEVDACLESFPKVKAAQSRLVTDPLAGPMVVASVVTSGKCVAEEIIDHCARNLAPYKVPRRIEFCERLP